MATTQRPVIVVEDDPFPRLIQVVLDPATPEARRAAFAHFFAHELPDFPGWCDRLRGRLPRLYPATVRLVSDEAALLASMRGAHVAVVESFPIGPPAIAAAEGTLRIAQKYGTVLSNIDQEACRSAEVRVLTLRRRANIACAEHALAIMLALARKILQTNGLVSVEQLRAAGYSPTQFDRAHTANANWARVTGTRTLYGKQLGILGLGEIGRELAMRAAAFGMRLVYTQRRALALADEARYGVTFVGLDELLLTSDFVSIHLPASDATRGIIGKRELALLKSGAILVNVSRPQLIDRAALLETLRAGRLGGFGLDPHYDTPGRPDDPLLALDNVIVTPHLAAAPRFNSLEDFEELLVGVDQTLSQMA
ncbi:MAG: NAD(P)-binding domain-containing protein [Betaproteobacteria bacterium]|nr:NAD(P)-binding domain-containing protein [Betaproteobacteria bacterium]MDH3412955.1 NAD(P)-binding domain-containing protein [Gammaproteobacteria bacterium]